MGTDKGLRYVKLENETLQIVPLEPLDKIQAQISSLYFHQESQRLFIGTFEKESLPTTYGNNGLYTPIRI